MEAVSRCLCADGSATGVFPVGMGGGGGERERVGVSEFEAGEGFPSPKASLCTREYSNGCANVSFFLYMCVYVCVCVCVCVHSVFTLKV